MSQSDFNYWASILKQHFPDHPLIPELGISFKPYTNLRDPEYLCVCLYHIAVRIQIRSFHSETELGPLISMLREAHADIALDSPDEVVASARAILLAGLEFDRATSDEEHRAAAVHMGRALGNLQDIMAGLG